MLPTADAATINWKVASGDWATTSNWDLNRLPIYSDSTNGGTASVTTNVGSSGLLYIGGANGGTVQMTGGSLAEYRAYVGYNGTGTFNQSGGTSNPSNYLYIGYNAGDTGSYNLSGPGVLSMSNSGMYVGYSGNGTFTQADATSNPQRLTVGCKPGLHFLKRRP
jgi:T5SS/PEP-CTERM-associated repeat protein